MTPYKSALEFIYDRSSLASKQKKEWFIPAADAIIDYAIGLQINDKSNITSDLGLVQGKLDVKFIREALRAYIPPEGKADLDEGHNLYVFDENSYEDSKNRPDAGNLPTYLNSIDFIKTVRDRYVGEYIRQFSEMQAYNRDPEAVMERNRKMKKKIEDLVDDMIIKLLEGVQSKEELEDINLDKIREEFIENWVDEKTEQYQHRLNLLNDMVQADMKYLQGFVYWFATEHVYTYRGIYGDNQFRKEVVHPNEYFRLPNTVSPFVKDDMAGVRRYQLNIKEIITFFGDKLDKKDVDYIKDIVNNHKLGTDSAVSVEQIKKREITYGDLRDAKDNFKFSKGDLVDVHHIVLQSIKPVKLLTYVALDGTIQQTIVDKDYQLEEEIGDKDLESIDTFETIEWYRIGFKDSGVYIKPEKLAVQTNSLPYNGICGFVGSGICDPIPRRIGGLSALHKFYTLMQQRAVAKYKNWLVIPESLMEDSEELTREEKLTYAKQDDILYINDEEVNANTLQALRAVIATNAERYIDILSSLIESTRKTALDIAGMNEQRYGDTSPNAGKAVTEYAITRATTASIALFYTYNAMKEQDAMLDLQYSKQLWKNGYKGSYYDKNTRKVQYVEIPPEEESPSDIGVFVRNNTDDEEKRSAMLEFAFAMGQNGQELVAIEAIDTDSAIEIKRVVKKAMKHKEELETQMRKYEEQMKLEVENIISQREEASRAHDSKLTVYKEEMANMRTIIESDTKLLIAMEGTEDTDNNEIEKKRLELQERKLELDSAQKKLDLLLRKESMDKKPVVN